MYEIMVSSEWGVLLRYCHLTLKKNNNTCAVLLFAAEIKPFSLEKLAMVWQLKLLKHGSSDSDIKFIIDRRLLKVTLELSFEPGSRILKRKS